MISASDLSTLNPALHVANQWVRVRVMTSVLLIRPCMSLINGLGLGL